MQPLLNWYSSSLQNKKQNFDSNKIKTNQF